jgi:haloalkane dehalogenase
MIAESPLFRRVYPFKSHWLDRRGLRYHYLDEGAGEPLLCVHGNPTWSFYYRNVAVAFRDTHRVVVPDHIGCGFSDKPGDEAYEYSLESRIQDLAALVDHLKLRDITLVLHDWGGAIGMGFAMRHPEKIKRLILFNTGAFHLPKAKPFPWQLYVFRSMILGEHLALQFNLFAQVASYICPKKPLTPDIRALYTAPYDSPKNRIATLRFVQDIPLAPGDHTYHLFQEIQDSLGGLTHLPTLICWGKQDFVFDHHFLAEWMSRFPQARVHRFPKAGHYVLEDEFPRIRELMHTFLRDHT